MRAWWVGNDDEGGVFVRAAHPTTAERFFPGVGANDLRVDREPRLDGPGPARIIDAVTVPCPGDGTYRDWCPDGCWEGLDGCERVDWDATSARVAGEEGGSDGQ